MLRPCLVCGVPSEGSRCPEHTAERGRGRQRASFRQRGYGAAWDRLSKRARRLQPWCNTCGATERLQADHLPTAWERAEQGKPLRLTDVQVLCEPCHAQLGSSRPGTTRAIAHTRGETPSDTPFVPSGEAKSRLLTSNIEHGEV